MTTAVRAIVIEPRRGMCALLCRLAAALIVFANAYVVNAPYRPWPTRVSAVVNRKVSGGNRSPRGAATHQIVASVIHTARLRGLNTRAVLVDLLRARQSIVSPALTVSE